MVGKGNRIRPGLSTAAGSLRDHSHDRKLVADGDVRGAMSAVTGLGSTPKTKLPIPGIFE